jgi:hypothetical protein
MAGTGVAEHKPQTSDCLRPQHTTRSNQAVLLLSISVLPTFLTLLLSTGGKITPGRSFHCCVVTVWNLGKRSGDFVDI